jgi:hypothetical protein
MIRRVTELFVAALVVCALGLPAGSAFGISENAPQTRGGTQACGIHGADVRLVQHEWSVVVRSYAADRMRMHKRFMQYLRETLDVIEPLTEGCPGEEAHDAFRLDVNIISTKVVGQGNETSALRKGARHGTRWASQMGLQHPAFRTL